MKHDCPSKAHVLQNNNGNKSGKIVNLVYSLPCTSVRISFKINFCNFDGNMRKAPTQDYLFQMRKQKHRDVKEIAEGHTAYKWEG
jgi:hypothetical protein